MWDWEQKNGSATSRRGEWVTFSFFPHYDLILCIYNWTDQRQNLMEEPKNDQLTRDIIRWDKNSHTYGKMYRNLINNLVIFGCSLL
jgi:hypothetical protein